MRPSGFQVTCANKNQNGIIVRVGGLNWSLSPNEAIYKLNENQLRLYILIGDTYFDIGVRGSGKDEYLALEPDGKALHAIEGLMSC